ncbi:MAG: rhodanese-like domain-containing protein [Chlorobium sp.]|uniref:rhodanese-like domain-containing protein n=1 Tax=Chlorobium sp. TaxID=1095 RepID=UPI0025B984F9|nr:rhodanese-like domain-containing protein [Chlorobium sp.]MCF8383669.1 rhodanese-like domain-containing protein [Chlorobium sp.]
MLTFNDLIQACLAEVREIMPWDLAERMEKNPGLLILDVREPYEFEAMHIRGSVNVPRGILESACEWDYDETLPELASARQREVVVVCRSGRRSVLAVAVMQQLGYENAVSLKTGLRGWNDYEEPLFDLTGDVVDEDAADEFFTSRISPSQRRPGLEDRQKQP